MDPAAPRSTARRSPVRRATRSAAPGRCRPSRSTSTCPSASASSTPPPTAPVSAGDDPPRPSARSSGSSRCSSSTTPARSRSGSRPCRWSASRSPTGVDHLRRRRRAEGAALRQGCRVEVDTSDDRMQRRSATRRSRRCRTCFHRGRRRRRLGRGVLPLPRRDAENGVPGEARRHRRDRGGAEHPAVGVSGADARGERSGRRTD